MNNNTVNQGYAPYLANARTAPDCMQARAYQAGGVGNSNAVVNYRAPAQPAPQAGAARAEAADITPIGSAAAAPMQMADAMPVSDTSHMRCFLRTQIGRRATIYFLIGPGSLMDRTGVLLDVGNDYILLNELDSNEMAAYNLDNLQFIKFYY